jgi:hypothetical protein
MKTLRPARRVLAIVGAALMSGCYSYVPVERPTPGSTVRIQVPMRSAATGTNQRPEFIGLEGTLLGVSDSLVLRVENRREIGAFREIKQVDTVRVARADLVGVDLRVFSKPKTIGLTAVVLGATAGLAMVALDLGGGSAGDDGGNGGPQNSLILKPVFKALLHALGR